MERPRNGAPNAIDRRRTLSLNGVPTTSRGVGTAIEASGMPHDVCNFVRICERVQKPGAPRSLLLFLTTITGALLNGLPAKPIPRMDQRPGNL